MSQTRVRLPDGSFVDVQTDDPQAAAAAARKHWANKNTSTWQDWQDNFIDNVTPNWSDEISGIGGGIGSFIQGRGFSSGFREAQQRTLERQAAYKKNHPTLAKTSAAAGTVASVVLPAGRALEGANLGRKALQGAKIGAAYGAVAGAGEGDGLDLGRRATNAASSAVTGAVGGAALPFAARGAQIGGRLARRYVPGVDAAASRLSRVPKAVVDRWRGTRSPPARSAAVQQADRMAAAQMNSGNIANGPALSGPQATPQLVRDEVARRNAMGVPAMVADVSEPLRELTGSVSRGIGPGQSMVRQRLAERKATEGNRIRQHVQDTFPTTPDPIAFVENQQRAAKAAAGPLYDQAYALPMYRTEPIQTIEQTPAFRRALPQAYDNIRNQVDPLTGQLKSPTAMGFRDMPNADPSGLPPNVAYFPHPDGNGYVAVDDGLTVEGYDQVARAMKAAGESAGDRNPITGRVSHNTNSVHVDARANDLRGHLRAQNEPYDQAVGRYGDEMTYANAFDQGQGVGRLTGHEVNAQRRSLPDQAHEAWATGAGTAMADEASQFAARTPNGDTSNAVRKMLGDDIKQSAIGETLGNSGAVRDLRDRLEYEHQGHLTWQGVNGNSQTPARQAADADFARMANIPTSAAGLKDRLVGFIAQRAAPQFQQDVKQRLAEILTASDASTVNDMLQAIHQQARRDQRFSDLLHTSGIAASAAFGANVAPSDPAR